MLTFSPTPLSSLLIELHLEPILEPEPIEEDLT